MTTINISKKLVEISKIIEKNGEGISYIHNEDDNYTIGTKKYSEKIVQYLNQTVETWKGCEASLANLKKRKGKNKQIKTKKIGYIWKIPISNNNLCSTASEE